MKEVTYKDWLKNPIPRMMWIWDNKEEDKIKRKVIYFVENKDVSHPVIALSSDGITTANYKHCAEIETKRRMTYKELSRWLRENPTREYRYTTSNYIFTSSDYRENNKNKEVHEDIHIRENDGEWKEPLIEVIDD